MGNHELIHIENSLLGYNNKKVIHIEKLSVNKGEFVVILGISGAGKSTMLETVGLMNDSFVDKKNIDIKYNKTFFEGNSVNKDLSIIELWKNKKLMRHVRNRHFSFIFQSTNLMPNFTIMENIFSTSDIQKNKTKIDEFGELTKKIGLNETQLIKLPNRISGGQRQRVAFARAILPDFTILFGDEPTGNLDERFAHQLMSIIQEKVSGNNNGSSSALIVSHNIGFALNFATKIVVLSKIDKQNNFFSVNNDTVFVKTNNAWYNNGKEIINMRTEIENLMYQNTNLDDI